MNMLSLIISINTRIESCCFYVAREKKREEIKALDVVAWALQTAMIKSHQKHFPSIYTLAQHSSSHHPLRAQLFISSKLSRLCDERLFRERFVCESHETTRKLDCVRDAIVGVAFSWSETCFVCRASGEREKKSWEKIWFRGWSWTTYNNELNIYHSVYLHHKEINVSSTFERKISFDGGVSRTTTTGVLWGGGLRFYWFFMCLFASPSPPPSSTSFYILDSARK